MPYTRPQLPPPPQSTADVAALDWAGDAYHDAELFDLCNESIYSDTLPIETRMAICIAVEWYGCGSVHPGYASPQEFLDECADCRK